ncbi:hypothetical protein SLEP1_g24437 [Rubroshorea leprosula]|uniref:Uncharacterized protein n=1 Tax=Rubroshorea leprosula TaxID=152421 RepID=A0AAV5JL03_9ROSI|nr:hypothetical protein SLEP1_g24437 [Rubroshorea leprosula]
MSERKSGEFCELTIFLSRPVLPNSCPCVFDRPVTLALGLGFLSCAIKVVRPDAWEARGSDELDG